MDIQYLLFLQDLRNNIHDAWTPFMEWVSMFAVTYLIFIPVFYYWNRDKKSGLYTLVSYYFCMVFTPLIKLTACVYRPWIRDSHILPAGDSITTATGYSFPSGHTTTAAPLAGGMAINTWKNKNTRWISIIFIIFILLTGFSRNYLGVHTPQDVLTALFVSLLSLFLTAKLFEYLDKNPEKEDLLLLGGFIFCWAAIAYITFKPYPMDLNAEGNLIVDPQKMMNLYYCPLYREKMDSFPASGKRLEKRRDLRYWLDTHDFIKKLFQSADDRLVWLPLGKTFLFRDLYLLLYRAVPVCFENLRRIRRE